MNLKVILIYLITIASFCRADSASDDYKNGEVTEELLSGLDRRAFRLLRADADEWLRWLDDEDFWMPGWGVESIE